MKITVSVTNDLVTDQRVHKVCTTLTQSGYEVKLVGRKFRNSLPLERIYQTDRLRLFFNRSVLFYAEYNIRLFFYLLFDKTDLFLSNDTDSLPANYLASKIRRKPLVFDAHEMFPEVPEIIDRKFVKKVWTKLEDWLFPHLKHCYTVCRSIADYYNIRYKIDMGVVRNIPPACEHEGAAELPQVRSFPQSQKIILYQGAVNIGRGIEPVIEAMLYLEDCVFYVVGDGDILQDLKEQVNRMNLNDKVIFTGQIPFERLPAYTACADIGVNLLENKGLNYYYSLPNRIFDYMRMRVTVLTSDFPEIRRIVAHYGTGTLVDHYEPQFLAETIKRMLAQGKNEVGFAAANAELSWENESETLLQVIREALKIPEKEMEKTADYCIAKIREIDFNQLDISDYNRKYIQNILPHIHYYFKMYMQAVSTFSNRHPDKKWVVDFGGGHGFLSLFLKSIGYRVIYCDINPLSVKTVSKIKEKTGFGPDEIVAGSVAELNRFCHDNHLKPDYLIATDLIEHVYDLQDFFRQLHFINPNFEMAFTTGSNPENTYKCRRLRRYMVRAEEVYLPERKNFIQTNATRLTETETMILAKLSRGKVYSDILKMLDAYRETGKLPNPPADGFNTCDPNTGNWTERILPLKTYGQFAAEAGFRVAFAQGFYNVERGSKIMSHIFRTLNFCIRKSGKSGFKLAPYLLIKLSPEHE